MRTLILMAAFACLIATGCTKTVVVNEGDGDEVNDGDAQDADSGNAWDGERWVVVGHGHHHRAGCGHHFHHGVWNIHVEGHVFAGKHHHFKARVVHHKRKH